MPLHYLKGKAEGPSVHWRGQLTVLSGGHQRRSLIPVYLTGACFISDRQLIHIKSDLIHILLLFSVELHSMARALDLIPIYKTPRPSSSVTERAL